MKLIKAPNSWLEKKVAPFDFNIHNAVDIEKQLC